MTFRLRKYARTPEYLLWEHYHMIRQRKRPNAKEAKTLKVVGEFKRSGFDSWKTSGIAASHRLASYLSDPREAQRIAADIAKLPELLRRQQPTVFD
jgi:hypothetical protein